MVALFYSTIIAVLYIAIIGGIIFLVNAKALGVPFALALIVVLTVIAVDIGSACLFGFFETKKNRKSDKKMVSEEKAEDDSEKETKEISFEDRIKAELANDVLCNHVKKDAQNTKQQ